MRAILITCSALAALTTTAPCQIAPPDSAPPRPAAAQLVIPAPPAPAPEPQPLPKAPLSGTSQIGPGANVLGLAPVLGEDVLSWGILHMHPTFAYSLSYGDSLQPSVGERVDSFIHEFSPGSP